jgi:uncharacterized coiled-coil protein SlyX
VNNQILEIGSKKIKGGRRSIKMALLTIHDGTDTNLNGLHWKEEFVLNNLDSLKSMPICCEFLGDEKEVPHGHGYTDNVVVEGNKSEPIFRNSECVGVIEYGKIETLEVNGVKTKVLVGYGYLYNQRYPNFVEWIKNNIEINQVKSSIEIVGTDENNGCIVYENGYNEDFRTPMIFDFSATAILSVKEADENAVVIEVAQSNKLNNTLQKENNSKEETETMDEKTLAMITDSVKATIVEMNSTAAEMESTITDLNAKLAEKDTQIEELNAKVAEMEAFKQEAEKCTAEKAEIEAELNAVKAESAKAELNSAIADFSDTEKAYAQAEIDAFNASPLTSEINSVTAKIYECIGKAIKAAEAEKVTAEQNSVKEKIDIFSDVDDVDATQDDGSIY